jgi:hypothetical protein
LVVLPMLFWNAVPSAFGIQLVSKTARPRPWLGTQTLVCAVKNFVKKIDLR